MVISLIIGIIALVMFSEPKIMVIPGTLYQPCLEHHNPVCSQITLWVLFQPGLPVCIKQPMEVSAGPKIAGSPIMRKTPGRFPSILSMTVQDILLTGKNYIRPGIVAKIGLYGWNVREPDAYPILIPSFLSMKLPDGL